MKKLRSILISLLIVSSVHAMDNSNNNQNDIDPIVTENKEKIALIMHKIALHVAPQFVLANFIHGVAYLHNNHNLEAVQIVLKNKMTTTVFANQISNSLKNEFKLAHEELEKHLPQQPPQE